MKLVIIGAGPAGEAAAKAARKKNPQAEIILIEKEQAGGLCLNKGCIPSKTLLEHVHKSASKQIDWLNLQRIKSEVVGGIRSQLETTLKTLKISLMKGTARFSGPASIEVTTSKGNETINFDKAILAAGTETYFPPPLDQFKDSLWDSDKMLEVSKTPKSIVIVGGGAVGCEFACLLNAAGSQVTIVEMKENLVPGEDPAVAAALANSFEARGIAIKTGVKIESLKQSGTNWTIKLTSGDTLEAEQLLACVGRVPSLESLALDKAGIKAGKQLELNDHLQTSNPNVYAAGDVAGTRLAHAASAQAEVAVLNAFGEPKKFDDRFVPRCLYTWPEVASVGQWKYQLENENKPVKASRAFFKGSAKALAAEETEGFVQIVSDPESGKILGAQIIGAHATELIHIFSVALKMDMTLHDLTDTIFAHPTLAEVVREAAMKGLVA